MQSAIEAISEPRRRAILNLIRVEGEVAAGRVAASFSDVTRPAISQHLRVLLGAGLVNERRDGTRRLYSVRPEGLDDLRTYLDTFWNERLEALRLEAENEQRRSDDDRSRGS